MRCGFRCPSLVVAGTGNGSLHHSLEAALLRARDGGVRVLRCSRVAAGPVFAKPDEQLTAGGELSPVQARVELLLQLLAEPADASMKNGPAGAVVS